MRAVVARVTSASVSVDGRTIARIGAGLLVLVGVTHSDEDATAARLADKIHRLRILPGERSLADTPDAAALVVSQFTLYADTRKGRRPGWSSAAPAAQAEPIVAAAVARLRQLGTHTETGKFGAYMAVTSVNDGPSTIILDV